MSIGSIVSLAARKIGDLLLQEAKLLYGVEDQVRSLERELTRMTAFLTDMEAVDEEGGDELSRTIITEIRKIAYDAEDVIESYILDANFPPGKMEAFYKRYVCFYRSLLHTHQVGYEIEAIKASLVETLESWREYVGPSGGIRPDARARMNRGSQTRRIAYSHTIEEHVIGLEEDINKLVGLLTTDDTKIQALSIVGMGGSGKTTLARKLYNHQSVKGHFDCIAWLSISKEWVTEQILLELLRKASGKKDETCRNEELVEKIHHYLEGKKYLIVLDDVWTKQALEEIFPALPRDIRKILITTRIQEVVDFPNLKCSIHKPRRLTKEESWGLFRKIALIDREQCNISIDIRVLETLGREMLKKCEGLPLAVIALAGILSKKETFEEWERVRKAVSSRILEKGTGTDSYGRVNEMLILSYNDLRRELKPCFLYLAMFQEDEEISTGQLIRMWIAEGFITSNMLQKGETLEDVARDHLEELIDRCVVECASKNYNGKVKSIRVHDLVRDLCIKKAKQQDFLEIFASQSSNLDTKVTELRRTARYSAKMYLPLTTQCPHLRSLLYHGIESDHQKLNLQPIHQNFRLLRVVFLVRIATPDGALPSGIGSLIHLRYLALCDTNILQLPASIGRLRNLQCLQWLQRRPLNNKAVELLIPNVLWKMESLRHLSIPANVKIKGRRWKLHTLKHLQTLKFRETGGPWMVEELPRLSPTLQKLQIHSISSKEQLESVFRCPSIVSDGLHSLDLQWNKDAKLENLQPISHCRHLRKLKLFGRIKDRSGSCNQLPASIVQLVLWNTGFEVEVELAALGELPNLVSLHLNGDSYKGAKWTVLVGQFTQLRRLKLTFLPNWEEWRIEAGAMPQLKALEIFHCRKLRRLPQGLKFITSLQELTLRFMGNELNKRAKGGGEDVHIIQHIPRVQIYG